MTEINPAVEKVRSLLGSVSLRGIYFDTINATRSTDEGVDEGTTSTTIEMEVQIGAESVAYRFRISADRRDVEAAVAVVTVYGVGSLDAFEDAEVQRTFGELVALPAAYPYARTKIHELTSGMAVPPFILDLFIPRAGSMEPVGAPST